MWNSARKWVLGIATVAAIALASPLVIDFEGNEPVGYWDSAGKVATAGVGHTGADVKVGQWYSEAVREGWLNDDLGEAGSTVERCAPDDIDVYWRAAFISFAFNVGPGKKGVKDGFCVLKSGKTPSHIRYARQGNKAASCGMLKQWDKAGGKRLKGLTRRRQAEYKLCMTEVKHE